MPVAIFLKWRHDLIVQLADGYASSVARHGQVNECHVGVGSMPLADPGHVLPLRRIQVVTSARQHHRLLRRLVRGGISR